MAAIAMMYGNSVIVVRRWIPLYRDQQAVAVLAFILLIVEAKRKTEALAIMELPLGQQTLTVSGYLQIPKGRTLRP
ncbi:hypothetical protein D3C84_1112130 [compost metagenome]